MTAAIARSALGPLLLLALPALGCGPVRQAPAADSKPDKAGQLRKEISDLARPQGCKAVGECKVAEVGHLACGGPRVYMVYCGTATDGARLASKLEELEKLEKEQPADPDAACKKPKRPDVELAQGVCRAK